MSGSDENGDSEAPVAVEASHPSSEHPGGPIAWLVAEVDKLWAELKALRDG
jgi:hypothetical protein